MVTKDIAAYQSGDPFEAALATQFMSGREITGPEKLAQRFLLELFTETDSMLFSARGCDFLSRIRSKAMLSEGDMLAAFHSSMLRVTNNLQTEETDADPDNERFAYANLTSMTITPGNLQLAVTVHNRLNEATSFVFPVNMNVVASGTVVID